MDVWWRNKPSDDPFSEVRDLLGKPIIVSPPHSLNCRVLRKVKRVFYRYTGARDLFEAHDLGVFFPIPPCDNPGLPYVFWLPDFQHMRRPELTSKESSQKLQFYYSDHVNKAKSIVLSSEDARDDFYRVFPERFSQAHVVRFCSVPDEDWWSLVPSEVVDKYRLPDRFFIVCNQFTRHKNHLTLIRAMHILSKAVHRDIHLVCTGSTYDHRQEHYIDEVRESISQYKLESRVHILGLLPRSEQIALLRHSIAILQPSLFEGWSTIIEDGKTLGKPVLASDIPVHREQLVGIQNTFISECDAEQWAEAIEVAWYSMEGGYHSEQECHGIERMEIARRECGMSFVKVLRSAIA